MPKSSSSLATSPRENTGIGTMNRKYALTRIASLLGVSLLCNISPVSALAIIPARNSVAIQSAAKKVARVAYRSMQVEIAGVHIPVALWYPTNPASQFQDTVITYGHRISVRRISQLLARWNFVPGFAAKQYMLTPSVGVVDGTDVPIPAKGPVVLLAHGYLGSRFDMSHLAEALSREGFICVSAEYPESLAASYEPFEGLDRAKITSQILQDLTTKWGIRASCFGIVGHSLGTGTALSTGDPSWARVCIAGFPRRRDGSGVPGNVLFVSSMNDGTVSFSNFGGRSSIPSDMAILNESQPWPDRIPSRTTVLFENPNAPNHISFLAAEVNDAMIDLLSPLLPVAQALKIPVLDFDKYKVSRDSQKTADVVIPLISKYLKQEMKC